MKMYGDNKLGMEKLLIEGNQYKGKRKTKFSCVRYGNVFGSRGSVIPKFIEQIRSKGIITVTDTAMTRFNITMDEALKLIVTAIQISKGSEVFIPKLRSYSLSHLIAAFKEISKIPFKIKKIPIRSGEKTHEELLNEYETKYAIESHGLYILFPPDV